MCAVSASDLPEALAACDASNYVSLMYEQHRVAGFDRMSGKLRKCVVFWGIYEMIDYFVSINK